MVALLYCIRRNLSNPIYKLPRTEPDMPKTRRHGGLSLFTLGRRQPACVLKTKIPSLPTSFSVRSSFQREDFCAGKAQKRRNTAVFQALSRSPRGKRPLKTILCSTPGSLPPLHRNGQNLYGETAESRRFCGENMLINMPLGDKINKNGNIFLP